MMQFRPGLAGTAAKSTAMLGVLSTPNTRRAPRLPRHPSSLSFGDLLLKNLIVFGSCAMVLSAAGVTIWTFA